MSSSGERPGGMPDPMTFWREMYQQTESAWGKVLEQNMGTEAYAAMIGQSLDAYVTFQKSLRDSMNRYLETMNLPSRDDLSRLGAQIVALETKIDAIDEKLDDIQDRLGGRDRQLDELRDSLAARDAQVKEMLDRFVAPQRAPGSSAGNKPSGG